MKDSSKCENMSVYETKSGAYETNEVGKIQTLKYRTVVGRSFSIYQTSKIPSAKRYIINGDILIKIKRN